MLTLTRPSRPLPEVIQPGEGQTRESVPADLDAIGRLYFGSYPPGVACSTLEEAREDVRFSFEGGYGEYWWEASPVFVQGDEVVGALMTVRRAIWNDVPDTPFIIELMVDPAFRRRGAARALLVECLRVVGESGEQAVGLRVAADNPAAIALYSSLGFVEMRSGED